jgi:hypothetical protein
LSAVFYLKYILCHGFLNLSRPNFGYCFSLFLLRREWQCWLYSFSVTVWLYWAWEWVGDRTASIINMVTFEL